MADQQKRKLNIFHGDGVPKGHIGSLRAILARALQLSGEPEMILSAVLETFFILFLILRKPIH